LPNFQLLDLDSIDHRAFGGVVERWNSGIGGRTNAVIYSEKIIERRHQPVNRYKRFNSPVLDHRGNKIRRGHSKVLERKEEALLSPESPLNPFQTLFILAINRKRETAAYALRKQFSFDC